MDRMDACVFVLSADPTTGRTGGLAATWLTRCAYEPPTWAVALERTSHTLALVTKSREFVLAFATPELQENFLYFGSVSGNSGLDKLTRSGLVAHSDDVPDFHVPYITHAHANIACRVARIKPCAQDYVMVYGTVVAHKQQPGTRQLFYRGKDAAGQRRFWPEKL